MNSVFGINGGGVFHWNAENGVGYHRLYSSTRFIYPWAELLCSVSYQLPHFPNKRPHRKWLIVAPC